MDLWRVPASGGETERLTHHNSEVSYAAPIDARTVLYVAREADGSGPWLWAYDADRKETHRVSFGLEKYTSISAAASGRRLVATVSNPAAGLWSIPLRINSVATEADAKPLVLPTVRALAPRFADDALFYLSSRGTGDGLWRRRGVEVAEIWKSSKGGLLEPAGISRDGKRVAVVLRRNGTMRVNVGASDGSDFQEFSGLDVRGTLDWSPDGQWIVTGGSDAEGAGLFKLPANGGAPVRLVKGTAANPVWSPDGTLIVYAGENVSSWSPLAAVRPDGSAVALPPIRVWRDSVGVRFLPDGTGLVYMAQGERDFWLLNLATGKTQRLTRLEARGAMVSFDITRDGRQIVFDRRRENSDIVLIDLPAKP